MVIEREEDTDAEDGLLEESTPSSSSGAGRYSRTSLEMADIDLEKNEDDEVPTPNPKPNPWSDPWP